MKQVFFFIPNFSGGGAENSACELSNEFIKNNIHTEIIVTQDFGPTKKILSKEVKIKNLNSKKMIFSLFKFSKYIIEKKPNYVITNLNHASFIALLAKRLFKFRTKIIITFVNKINFNLQISNIKNLIYVYFIKFLIGSDTNIITITKGIKDDLINNWNFNKKLITVIYPPSNIDKINHLMNKKNDDPLFKNKKNKYILSVGRLNKQKDHVTLIKAFKLVIQKFDVELILIGEGDEYQKLKKLTKKLEIETKIHFRKYTLNPYYYMKNCDLFILSSRWEGFAIVLVNALQCNIPIISTDCEYGPKEILENGKWGKLSKVGNVEDLYLNIIEELKLNKNKKLLDTTIRAENFSLKNSAQNHLKLFK